MSDDIKELAQWLRENGQTLQDALGLKNVPFRLTSAADALEALVEERDRLKAAIRLITSHGDGAGCNPASFTEIARKALEGKE